VNKGHKRKNAWKAGRRKKKTVREKKKKYQNPSEKTRSFLAPDAGKNWRKRFATERGKEKIVDH